MNHPCLAIDRCPICGPTQETNMKDFQPARENNLYNREAVVCGGVCNGQKAWIIPGGHITHSRKVAEKALRIMGRIIGGSRA